MPDDATAVPPPIEPTLSATTPLLSRRSFLAAAAASAAVVAAGVPGSAAAAPRPPAPLGDGVAQLTPKELDSIVRVRIHPGVGIGRVGNSEDAFYLGPEVSGDAMPTVAELRDPQGAVARQAQRYRIFGYDADNKVVGEVRAADATIAWRVHLANRKAAWYDFGRAMDIPEAPSTGRRNPSATARHKLVLDAGDQAIEGVGVGPVNLRATAKGIRMLLGELLTDDHGRLVVLAGKGRAASWKGNPVTTFANNDGWLDDVADGPVRATVTIGERELEAVSAWFASGPPNFVPMLSTGWRTMHDVLEDLWTSAGWMGPVETISFQRHIRPLFTRLAALQWVNKGVLRDHGWKSEQDLSDPDFLARLADPSLKNRPFRRRWARRFRDLESGEPEPQKLPPILGDVAGVWSSPRAWIGPTQLQLHRLDEWAAGRFEPDSIDEPEVPTNLGELPLARRPRSLDRAALEGCLAEAFDPGCELPWAMRRKRIWARPYRLKVREGDEPDFGTSLTPSEAVGPGGPLDGCVPGALTRWLALPWMTDTINCRAGYQPQVDPYLDTFWAGRVPNHVLTQADYAIVMDTERPLADRRRAFKRRRTWWRGMLTGDYVGSLNRMVRSWHTLGFVMRRPGPDGAAFPDVFGVELGRQLPEPAAGTADAPNVLPREVEARLRRGTRR